MGLGIDAIEAVLKEHTFQPVNGDVLLIGRQTIYFSPLQILELMKNFGISSCLEIDQIELDKNTLNRREGYAADLISDFSFFNMLGARSVKALDHSPYEGAEIIHDLSQVLPTYLYGTADFIVDGSTLDNTFNPVLTLQNLVNLLRPGGRILLGNVYSNDYEPYNMLPPLWYQDYFTMNGFVDCKVYIIMTMPGEVTNNFCMNLDTLYNTTSDVYVGNFKSPYMMATMVFAEKGHKPMREVFPIQQHYRPKEHWDVYRKNLEVIMKHPRPHVCRSRSPLAYMDIKRGHLFMNSSFEAVDPTTEAKRLQLI